jgi:hypothetical protein
MGYDNEYAMQRHVVIDIEATGIADAAEFLEPVAAPSNYRDPEKIAAYIAEANLAAVGKCALDPDLARIVAIGIVVPEAGTSVVLTAKDEEQERNLLAATWAALRGHVTVGYNVLGYDLPVLLRRSLYLGVPAPAIQIDKYRHPTVIDLMQVLSFNGAIKFRGLKFYTKRFGIPVSDTITGAEIPKLVEAGQWDQVIAHVTADVEATVALARKLGVINAVMEDVAV